MEIDTSIRSLSITERSLPLFFCKQHPKFELNLVCRENRCSQMGLICAKCLEENHTNQIHNKKSFLGIDDIIGTCHKVASPIILSEYSHPAYFKDTNEDNQFYKLDKLCKATIERLRDFKYKINTLIKKLELNLKENILQIRKRAINNLGDVGELLNFVHQKVGYNEIINKGVKIQCSNQELLKNITNNQLNSSAQNASALIRGSVEEQKFIGLKQSTEEQGRQIQFTNIIKRITSCLSSDAKILQIKEINDYIHNYEEGLIEYEGDIKNEIDHMVDLTTTFIKKFYLQNQDEDENISQKIPLQHLQINQLTQNKIYTNLTLNTTNTTLKNIYTGKIPCWLQLIDIIKDLQSNQHVLTIIRDEKRIQKCLYTTSQSLLENDDFLNSFTTTNMFGDTQFDGFNSNQQNIEFLLYTL